MNIEFIDVDFGNRRDTKGGKKMKKILAAVMVMLLCSVFNVFAAELKVGDKAPIFLLKTRKVIPIA